MSYKDFQILHVGKVTIERLNNKQWGTAHPLPLEFIHEGRRYSWILEKGFVTDGASIPRIFWTLTGVLPTGAHLEAAVFHDIGYQRQGNFTGLSSKLMQKEHSDGLGWMPSVRKWTRAELDNLFHAIMVYSDVTGWKRALIYRGVALFGKKAWEG